MTTNTKTNLEEKGEVTMDGEAEHVYYECEDRAEESGDEEEDETSSETNSEWGEREARSIRKYVNENKELLREEATMARRVFDAEGSDEGYFLKHMKYLGCNKAARDWLTKWMIKDGDKPGEDL